MADEIDGLQDQAEDLRTSARRTLALSALTALSSLSGALRAAAIAARAIRNRNRRQLSRQDALDLLSALGPVGAAAAALIAAADLREANQLARKADRLENAGKSLSEELIDALRDYDQNDCGRGGDITS